MLLTDLLTLTHLNLWLMRKVHSFEKKNLLFLEFRSKCTFSKRNT